MRTDLFEMYSCFNDSQKATQWRSGYRFVNTKLKPLTKHAEYNKARQTQTKVIHDWAVNKFLDLVKTINIDGERINIKTIWVNRTKVIVLSLNNRYALIIIKNLINPIANNAVAKTYKTLTEAERRLKTKHSQDKFWRILVSPKPQREGQHLITKYAKNGNFVHWQDLPYTAPKRVNDYAEEKSGVDYSYAYDAKEDWNDGTKKVYVNRLRRLFQERKPKDIFEKPKRTLDVFERERLFKEHYLKMDLAVIRKILVRKEESHVSGVGLLLGESLVQSEELLMPLNLEITSKKTLPIDTIYKNSLIDKKTVKKEDSRSTLPRKVRRGYRRLAPNFREKVVLSSRQRVWVRYYGKTKPYYYVKVKILDKWRNRLIGHKPEEVGARLDISKRDALKMCIEALRQYTTKPRTSLKMKRAQAHLELYEKQADKLGVILAS